MKCSLIKINNLSGSEASIYTIIVEGEQASIFDRFIIEHQILFKSEIKDIATRLKIIGSKTGAREQFFKHFEGKSGDGICALYDTPGKKLRLYCIRYGTQIIILGSGGPKKVRALQEDPVLTEANYFLRWLSEQITERIKSKEITYSLDTLDFLGNLEFDYDETY